SNDFAPGSGRTGDVELDLLSDRVAVREVLVDELLIYEHNARRCGVVMVGEAASAEDRDTDDFKGVWSDDDIGRRGLLGGTGSSLGLDGESHPTEARGRKIGGPGRAFDAGDLAQLSYEVANKLLLLRSIRIPCLIEPDARRHQMIVLESQFLMVD